MGYYFIKKRDIEGDEITLKGKEFKHLKEVLRSKVGETVILITGDGEEYHALISKIRPSYITAKVRKITRKSNEPGIHVAIAISPPKAKRMDWFIEKATEIGVSEVIPVVTKRSVVIPGAEKVNRWKRVARSAVKQSERSILPKIGEVISIDDLLRESVEFPLKFIAYEKERKETVEDSLRGKKETKILALVGPEGGFEEWEVRESIGKGFIPVSLGVTKLRTETAGITILTRILAAG
jgi:16S rRNA (uracil1498-N3)-methyltransferase